MSGEPTHPAALDPEKLLAQCKVRHTRRSGPGGQHRNKVETAVVIEHLPSGIIAEANERRSQAENHRQAVFRLRVKLAIGLRLPSPRDEPSALWQGRCRGGKVSVSPTHDDFPALLAEALDALEGKSADVPAAAETLGCTATQFVKLLRLEPAALAGVNARRAKEGLRTLR